MPAKLGIILMSLEAQGGPMTKLIKRKNIIVYIILLAMLALILKTINVFAEETSDSITVKPYKVIEVEINNNPDFSEIKKEVLSSDIKYIAHPEKLEQDVLLSEIVASDIDYASYKVQEVEFEVSRFTDSQSDKTKIDSVVGLVNLQFVDKTAPEITIKKNNITITEGEKVDVEDYLVKVTDNSFEKIEVEIEENINTDKAGEYTAVYSATDSSGNQASETLTVNVKEKPKPKPVIPEATVSSTVANTDFAADPSGSFRPSRLTRYGYDCAGCTTTSNGYSKTASGIQISADRVRQSNGEWALGLTYDGYHIVATSSNIPLFSILKISNHPFSGGGITAGQPFFAIVGDRGVGGTAIDLFIGSEKNINAIRQSGNPSSSNTVVEVVRYGR